MKRSVDEIRENMDYVGCDNATALEMCDEIDRLQAIVDTLKTTADGVPIVQDTDYWLPNDGGEPVIVHTDRSGPMVMCRDGAYAADEMYSTREAAENARHP